ncbi:MAG: cation diffusion facilitator family transporter [Bacteroidales bacterium]|nr:cation diffusion facilitator family transporter [Bacteroidales bacterium]
MELKEQRYVAQTGWISMSADIFLFAVKYWAGIISGSIALIADAWDTLTDCFSALIVVVGGKLANKPADHEHPYGHGRAEHITAMAIGVVLAILSYNFIVSAWHKFVAHEAVDFGCAAFIVTFISIVCKQLLARYELRVFRRTQSPTIKANSWNHQTDVFASAMLLAGITLGRYVWWMDALMAFLIACMIGYTSYGILAQQVKALLGGKIDPQLAGDIAETVIEAVGYDVHIHNFHLHDYGRHRELSCHIMLPPTMALADVHAVCSKVETTLADRFGIIATVHPEPLVPCTPYEPDA